MRGEWSQSEGSGGVRGPSGTSSLSGFRCSGCLLDTPQARGLQERHLRSRNCVCSLFLGQRFLVTRTLQFRNHFKAYSLERPRTCLQSSCRSNALGKFRGLLVDTEMVHQDCVWVPAPPSLPHSGNGKRIKPGAQELSLAPLFLAPRPHYFQASSLRLTVTPVSHLN